jgi:hypothetical protein
MEGVVHLAKQAVEVDGVVKVSRGMVIQSWTIRFIEEGIQCLNNLHGSVLVMHCSEFAFIMSNLSKPLTVLCIVDEDIHLIRIVKG